MRNAGLQFRGSHMRFISIILASLLVAGTVGAGSWEAFHLMAEREIPFAGSIIGILFDFLFISLFLMLFFSSGIIVYGSMFSSPETAFLLSTPARADHIFAYKFQSAMAFSSWGFLLLGCPILFAYGIVYAVSWHFFALLPVLLLGFVLLPGSLGSIVCFLVANFLPQRRRQVLIAAILILLFAMLGIGIYAARESKQIMEGNKDAIQDLFGWFEFARSKFAPSHWVTESLLSTARGDLKAAALPTAMTWSNGLFAYLVATVVARLFYRRGYNRIATGGNLRRRYGGSRIDAWLTRGLGFLDSQTRLLIIKDFRTFRRDPVQWAQILIFAGLVMLYVLNSRQFTHARIGGRFGHGVSMMNLSATAMLMCAFMGRFIFPLMSLEGKKFWILGLLPMRRERLLWGKFYFAAAGSLLISLFLILISDTMLEMDWTSIGLHLITVTMLSVGSSGLSVGLGATMPNFRETDPSKIAVGFGGTLNLIAGLMFLILVIGLISAPYHVYKMLHEDSSPSLLVMLELGVGVVLGIGVGLSAVIFPLRMGIRNLREMEF
jgi:ABC-2 type transport system permease protein